ncbi:MAG: hypothetical protein FJ405_11025, partial [Verrucomicrobia bacterium]|nr:hypothetical protein [Verrucomicrobiota bacterium]
MHTSTKAFFLRSLVFTAATFRWLIVGVAWVVGVTVQAQTTGVSRDLFRGVSTNDNTYATTVVFTNLVPSANSITPDFETPNNLGDAFGDRLRAFILPSITGNHVFGIASDEWSDLFLSDGEFPAGRTRIAFVNEATAPREYTREPNQQSAPVFLEAGRRYYIEAVRKEGRGPDHLSVRWIMPDGSLEEPIPGRSGSVFRLLPYRTNTINVPSLLGAFPTNLTLAEGREARLSAAAANNSPISYQWQLNGVDIPGATTSSFVINPLEVLPNNGQRYRCILSNSVRTTNTAEVLLTVLADLTPPTVAQILYTQSTRLIVRFSEPLLPASATRADQYVLDGGVSVLSAVMASDSSVVLTTSPMTYGSTYKLSVSGIQDRIRSPNTITPGTQVSFLAVEFNPSDIGAVTTPSTSTLVPGGFDVRVAGRDIGGSSDQ